MGCALLLCLASTARSLAEQVTKEDLDAGLIYPPFRNIRKISAAIAAAVAGKAYDLGMKQEKYVESVAGNE
jgi:malate dehydrogenase (oxaloacetate-decarboxylating)(NADP+)